MDLLQDRGNKIRLDGVCFRKDNMVQEMRQSGIPYLWHTRRMSVEFILKLINNKPSERMARLDHTPNNAAPASIASYTVYDHPTHYK